MPRRKPCEFCSREIDTRGYAAHLSFRHVSDIVRQFKIRLWFSTDPHTRLYCAVEGIGPKLLKA